MEITSPKLAQAIVQSSNKFCIDFHELFLEDILFNIEHHQRVAVRPEFVQIHAETNHQYYRNLTVINTRAPSKITYPSK